MNRRSVCQAFLILGLLCVISMHFAQAIIAEEPSVSANVDKQTANQDEEIALTIKVSDVKGNIAAPKLPNFSGFDTFYAGRSSHFAFINGRSSSTVEFSYILVPKAAGVFTLDPIDLNVNGKTYRTDPIQIEVLGKRSSSSVPSIPPARNLPGQSAAPPVATLPQHSSDEGMPLEAGDSNIFLRVNPSKRTVYSNEQVVLTYSLLTRYDTRYEGFEKEPETSGFWVEEFPVERDLGKQTETINGRKYVRADIRKTALFPTAAGEYVIKPGSVKASVQIEQRPTSFLDEFFNDSFFSNAGVFARRVDKILTAQPITIIVKPLPAEGKPKNFSGVVGDFRMSSEVDKLEIKQNEPVTYRLTIEGEGNIETLAHPPIPELPEVKVYDTDTKTEFFKSDYTISGKKKFEIAFIPKRSGILVIPALEFAFFNPRLERYVNLKTETYSIRVTPSLSPMPEIPSELAGEEVARKKEIKVVAKDISYIRERLKKPSNFFDVILQWLVVVNVCLSALLLLNVVMKRRDEIMNRDPFVKMERSAGRRAQKSLARLKRLAGKQDERSQKRFFDDADRLMNQYLAAKLHLSAQGLTLQEVSEKLAEKGISDEMVKKVARFYDVCSWVRFGRAEKFETTAKELLELTREILKIEL